MLQLFLSLQLKSMGSKTTLDPTDFQLYMQSIRQKWLILRQNNLLNDTSSMKNNMFSPEALICASENSL